MITLLIKGDEEKAKAALERRCLSPIELKPYVGSISRNTTYTKALIIETDENAHKVATWYCEEGEAPFPEGSLLHYSLKSAEASDA